jgi:hypothetical protein
MVASASELRLMVQWALRHDVAYAYVVGDVVRVGVHLDRPSDGYWFTEGHEVRTMSELGAVLGY